MPRSLFFQVSSLTPDRIVSICDRVLRDHRGQGDRIQNFYLTGVCDDSGNLYQAQLDAIRPYLPGGSAAACDNVFVGSAWKQFTPAAYGLDKNQWFNHYAVWGGVLSEGYRWDQIYLSRKAWKEFKARYSLPWIHFYLDFEADLNAFIHPTLGGQVRGAYEALLTQLCNETRQVEDQRSVAWSPFHWQPFTGLTVDERAAYRKAVASTIGNVENLSGQGVNFLDLQDGLGARPGVVTPTDAIDFITTTKQALPGLPSLRMNVEWFQASPTGFTAVDASPREKEYVSRGHQIGACWEARYVDDIWRQTAPVPTPGIPSVEFLTRSQWGARTDLPRLGYFVPASRRTELHVHHTAAVDGNDSTPNRWTRDEAIGYMRRLQTARPDLGKDIPYSRTLAVSEDCKTVWMFEGRGDHRTGAHTAGHNTAGFGWSILGNFDHPDPQARDAALAVIQNEARYLKANGFPNLCSSRNPKGWDVWGHRDTAPKSCPGNTLYPSLAGVEI